MNCAGKNIPPTKKTKRLSHGVHGRIAQKHVAVGKESELETVLQTFVAKNLHKRNPVLDKDIVHLIHGVRGLVAQEHVALGKEQELGNVLQTCAVKNLRRLKNVTSNIA